MTELVLDPPAAVSPPGLPHDTIRDVLMESRQRWQNLVGLAADLAFETDVEGRFVFMMPDTVLGWPAGSLIGQPSECLIGDDGTGAAFNPFRPVVEMRRHRAWLRRGDGRGTLITVSATPLYGAAGQVIGGRGIGVDMTDYDAETSQVAERLRRGQLLHHIISHVGAGTDTDSMMDSVLWALIHALGAEGAAVIGAVSAEGAIEVLHECGPGASDVLEAAAPLVVRPTSEPGHTANPDGRLVLAVACQTRFSARAGLVIWRGADARPWDREDTILAGSAGCIVRMILEYDALQRQVVHQARTDPLTGLLNRRAFVEAVHRDIARLDRAAEAGTLMFVDMDSFKSVNEGLGHGMGDQVLIRLADMLRKLVRPSDLITRMGGDEFAVWLSGADHMTAAERADHLCKTAPRELQEILPEAFPKLGVSVGIATRRPGSRESVEDLTRRADMAMYEVKRSGRQHWRVSLLDGDA